MFISKFSTENWQGDRNKIELHSATNWADIELAIKALDGKNKTLVTLETEEETHMSIGGGKDEYIVYLTFDNEVSTYLIDPSKSDAEQSLVIGGQESFYPAKLCVDLHKTLKTAKTFAELGAVEKSVIWEQNQVLELV